MTDLAQEKQEQARWRLLPHARRATMFDQLVANEFTPRDQLRDEQNDLLRKVVRWAATQVPFYERRLAEAGVDVEQVTGIDDLPRLPVLAKHDLIEQRRDLMARSLPQGDRLVVWTKSSGSTGRPAIVAQTALARNVYAGAMQREARWFRIDPLWKAGASRLDLPPMPDGEPVRDGQVVCLDSWPVLGRFFETGPFIGFRMTNPIERQIDWIVEHEPDYFTTQSPNLEHLAWAWPSDAPPKGMKICKAISMQLTDSMRRRIEATFDVPVQQNYGLNETAVLAIRCPQSGCYHTHPEVAVLEIVDDDNQPVEPGQPGRVLVTTLTNYAMPLIRYDTDDLATAGSADCPCGRTMPTIGDVVGRYSRLAFQPSGAFTLWRTLRGALETLPDSLAEPIRKYQVHLHHDMTFELRLQVERPLEESAIRRIHAAWADATESANHTLKIQMVDHIPAGPGGKFQDFLSDFKAPDEP